MSNFEKKNLPNGKPNPKYVDVLRETTKVRAGQEYVLLSFLSPEKILKQRDIFLFENFVREWDFTKCMEKSVEFVNFISYKYGLNSEAVLADFNEFVREEAKMLKSANIEDEYKNFLDRSEAELTKKFNIEHDFQTSVRGVKFYGAFSSQKEAEAYIKEIDEDDIHTIHNGPAGRWLYWDPDPHKTSGIKYQEEELNRLCEEKIKNEKKKDEEFKQRVQAAKRKAIEENIAKARQNGAMLTQTIDEQGNLIGVKESGILNLDERDALES